MAQDTATGASHPEDENRPCFQALRPVSNTRQIQIQNTTCHITL
jgi:hypothetical protein